MTKATEHLCKSKYIFSSLACWLMLGIPTIYGQSISGNTIFKKQALNEISQKTPKPQQQQFEQITTVPVTINNVNPILGNSQIEQQNRLILQKQGMLPGQNTAQKEQQKLRQELRKEEMEAEKRFYLETMRKFQSSLQEFLKMNPDSFSIIKAIYITESAWLNKAPTYQQFENAIQLRAELVKQILEREGINPNSNIAKTMVFKSFLNKTTNSLIQKQKKYS